MDAILFRPDVAIEDKLEAWLRGNEEKYFRLDQNKPMENWRSSREGQVHRAALQAYVLTDPTITIQKYSLLQQKLINRGYDPRGRPRVYRASKHNLTFRRALRLWLMNKLLAEALSAEFITPPPEEPIQSVTSEDYEPIEALEMLQRFEAWTEYALPRKAYVIHTREDRTLIREALLKAGAAFERDWTEVGDKCVKFEEYLSLRDEQEYKQIIEECLEQAYRPVPRVKRVKQLTEAA